MFVRFSSSFFSVRQYKPSQPIWMLSKKSQTLPQIHEVNHYYMKRNSFWRYKLHQVSVYWVHRRVWRVIVHCRLNGIRLVILITCSKTRTSRQPTWELKCFKAQCVCVWERERDRERESVLKLLVDIWKIKYVICRWVTKKIRSGTAKGRAANVWYYANPIRTSIKFELYFLVRLRGFFAIPNSSIPHCDELYY